MEVISHVKNKLFLFICFVQIVFINPIGRLPERHNQAYITIPNVNQSQSGEINGGLLVDSGEFSEIPVWNPPKHRSLTPPPPVKDLRYNDYGISLFPEIGRQQMNDCTAWASAYYLKTYLEAVDNNWVPDRPSRIFSPSYIYNQINSGRDQGSSVTNALKLMYEQGAATLQTMPYTTNFTARPTNNAFNEAKKYKINKYYSITSLAEIKNALQLGHPLLVGIVTDATFNSGKYKIFNKTLRDNARDRLGSSHGRHAMVIVAYDDDRRALLFLNSWGSQWGEKGYVWVSYDLFGKIGYDNKGANFLEIALVAIDEKSNIETAKPDKNSIQLKANTWFSGIDEGNHGYWGWKAKIEANEITKSIIQKIEWDIPEELEANNNTNLDYELTGVSHSFGANKIGARINFTDGTSKKLNFVLEFNEIKRGALKFIQADKYYGKINNQDYWDWSIKIDGSLTDLHDIQKVIYHLHKTFKNPNVEVISSPENGFAYSTRGWGTFEVGASVYFKDGTIEKFTKMLKFTDKVKPKLRLTNSSVPLEKRDGQTYYNWTAFLEGSEMDLAKIQTVEYILHPSFKNNQIKINQGKDFGFPMSAIGWGTFPLKAIVYFNDGSKETLTHNLDFKD
ncbi:C1 family peptidase [Leptospira sp. 96542]|nr:C1 family peptidase [Leptospira sp. 96542]